ncbi:hypothetical protein H072_1879 [Dactylellina haptotyla CBS 200.50]|uniref:CBM21 domain-containing protein n=1 Tax=Dactylellina haptotyla (strain CBS 200.50) TaxID=1284197 RepID=S8AMJ6_DACHA|nr:hypothetical protein H072_1879 [Dactylellina haptotyla CBS 200.50]
MDTIVRRNVLSISREPTICPLCSLDISAPDEANTTDTLSTNLQEGVTKKPKFQVAYDDDEEEEEEEENHVATTDGDVQTKHNSVPEENLDTIYHIKLATHIAGHLKSLAFVSLRYFDDDSHSTQSEGGALGEEVSNQERSGDHYFELDSSLSFEDILPDKRVLIDENEWRDKNTLFKPSLKGPSTDGIFPGPRPYAKAVHFDGDLEQVRYFRPWDKPNVPPINAGSPEFEFESDKEYPLSSLDTPRSLEITSVNIPERDYSQVCIGEIKLSEKKDALEGSIVVELHLAPRTVAVRFTLDDWKTTSEVLAHYSRKVTRSDGFEYDEWSFRIKLSDITRLDSRALEFCIRYTVGNWEAWDNNSDKDYRVNFKENYLEQAGSDSPRPDSPVAAPRPRQLPTPDPFGFNERAGLNTSVRTEGHRRTRTPFGYQSGKDLNVEEPSQQGGRTEQNDDDSSDDGTERQAPARQNFPGLRF